ncbi:MAG: hypothetical protein JXR70_11950 [Spirochaetales bacterium]|nr:hypothetical protein [Spirochaetales bacterium]
MTTSRLLNSDTSTGFYILDIHDLESTPIRVEDTFGKAAINGNYLYTSQYFSGVIRYDISDINNVSRGTEKISFKPGAFAEIMALDENYVYCDVGSEIQIAQYNNISDAIVYTPCTIEGSDSPIITGMKMGTTLYLAIKELGAAIIDVTDPSAPSLISTIDVYTDDFKYGWSIAANDQLLALGIMSPFVTDDTAKIRLYDISDKSAPVFLRQIDLPDHYIDKLDIQGSRLYAGTDKTFIVINLTEI